MIHSTPGTSSPLPGPTPHPIVGHLLQVPKKHVWKYFESLGQHYGPVVGLSLAGDNLVILNDAEDAEELLNRRSHNYSSRKQLVYAGKYQSHGKRLVLLPYGPQLKQHRAAFHQMLQPKVVGSYESMQEEESAKYLYNMLVKPGEADLHSKRYAAATVFRLSYGKSLSDDDEDLKTVLIILDGFIRDCYPGSHLVDTFPILDSLPDFLAPWRISARRKHDYEIQLYGRLLDEVKVRLASGDDSDCFAARLLQANEKNILDAESLAYVVGSAFVAGTDTTAGTFMWFLMAVILYPETLRKAQAEIDGLPGLGPSRAPDLSHMNSLPYCVALTKELFRWMPAAPGGFPHLSDADDVYKGYFIKGKSMVIPNIWAMQHNERLFPEPLSFNPDRFMQDIDGRDDLTQGHYGFGFGRRVCPGRYLGARTVWIGITRLIWGFNICPGVDSDGRLVVPVPDNCTSGITSKPLPFSYSLVPRSDVHAETIRCLYVSSLGRTKS
ncbi:cytochrome P450 [Neolentinus lepideus HHB14362 ss-1]|uniref:Cytochrome P450 n=1 Tax=Neolentinus lepideus HHB14362 ss-1 TaxID=1314782 RepID=A0A165VQ57_9AGAM|nr:cytochrome P450 [Neolentinus lepideus HHB14362 ss-1]